MIKVCLMCNKEFEAKQKRSKCCSGKCYVKNWKLNNRDAVSQYNKKYYQNHRDELSQYKKEYNHSYEGHIVNMANHALKRAKRFNLDCEPQEVLVDFVRKDKAYKKIHNNWDASGHKRKDAPSIDRIDVLGGYTLDNIQIITQSDNARKGCTIDRKRKLEYQQETQLYA